MILKQCMLLAALPVALLVASDPASWKDKQIAQWSDDDVKQVLTDSPWAQSVTPIVNQQSNQQQRQRGMGRRGGMGGGGIGMGIPGMGYPGGGMGGGRRGGGYPQDGSGYPQDGSSYPQDGTPSSSGDSGGGQNRSNPPTLTVRWESALPIQQALLKSKDANAPTIDEKHYAIVVMGLPARMASTPQMTEDKLKGQAELRHDGKKLEKPSRVRVISRDDQLIVVYLFDKKKEISQKYQDVQLVAHLGRYEIRPTFEPAKMMFQGKLEL
jgi:hypothetical protein